MNADHSSLRRRSRAAGKLGLGLLVGLAFPANGSRALTAHSLPELMALKIEQGSTASRFTQPTGEAPAAVSVITSEEIAMYGHRTLAAARVSRQKDIPTASWNTLFNDPRPVAVGERPRKHLPGAPG